VGAAQPKPATSFAPPPYLSPPFSPRPRHQWQCPPPSRTRRNRSAFSLAGARKSPLPWAAAAASQRARRVTGQKRRRPALLPPPFPLPSPPLRSVYPPPRQAAGLPPTLSAPPLSASGLLNDPCDPAPPFSRSQRKPAPFLVRPVPGFIDSAALPWGTAGAPRSAPTARQVRFRTSLDFLITYYLCFFPYCRLAKRNVIISDFFYLSSAR
jgi:hypothetical protein